VSHKIIRRLKANILISVILVSGTSTYALASHDDFIRTDVSDTINVESKSYKRNWFVWRAIGGESKVFGTKKIRKWWCAWLCRRPVSKNAERITILNTYYAEITPENYQPILERFKECSNSSECLQREFAVGAAIKLPFPGAGGIDNLLPVSGVITQHTINIDGFGQVRKVTSKGDHGRPTVE